VLATDWSASALDLLRRNADRNGARLELARVDWALPEALLERAPFDLVLAADVLYERRNLEPLLDLMGRLAGEVWLADPGRPPLEDFLAAAAAGWAIERRGTVHRLRRQLSEGSGGIVASSA
jgi:predicted nicotinamide N-methyase